MDYTNNVVYILEGSNIRLIVPDTQAVLRGSTNSNPSLETKVTNLDGVEVEVEADMM